MISIKKVISNNLIKLRKEHKLTQLELAQKINYSDKAISRWENGDVTPDIETLSKLSLIYDISITRFFDPNLDIEKEIKELKHDEKNKLLIALLAISCIWILATSLYATLLISFGINEWKLFVAAFPLTFIVALIFNSLWGKRTVNFILISLLIWTGLLTICLALMEYNIWPILLIGIPAQIVVILWSGLRRNKPI